MSLKDEVIKTITKVAALFDVERPPSDTEQGIDLEGTPDTNDNYGGFQTVDGEDLSILMCCQHISDNDTKNSNYIEYQKNGYTQRGLLKIKSLEKLYEKDIITYSDGFEYEVFEKTDRYLPDISKNTYEYAYTQALALKKENQ